MAKTIIVSNRLPVRINETEEGLQYLPSEGGLATGLGSIYRQGENLWIGWPGIVTEDASQQSSIRENLKKEYMQPVFLTEEDIHDYYEGFSNETLWPVFHYFLQYAEYDQDLWQAYVRVNRKFCDEILRQASPGDTLWIHDYQLLLLPGMIREELRNATIGFFLHIPFPSFEVFRLLPWRKEILNGMLGSDLIGFHTYDDMRHFLSSVSRIVGLNNIQGHIETGDRTLVVDSFPMGIDYEKYASSAKSPATAERVRLFKRSIGDQKLILSIDRLDYSKGIAQRLKSYELFIEQHPEFIEKVSLHMVVVPSRDQVEKYRVMKVEIDELVGRINGKYSRVAWTPVHYYYRSFPLDAISAFYCMADVALVTPMRDGMNLVCKEFIASKNNSAGALILSEMAGASKELTEAILINPNDINQIAEAIYKALTMPENEQKKRMERMQKTLQRFNIHHWVRLFMDRLHYIKEKQAKLNTRPIDESLLATIQESYRNAKKRLLFLDYAGTLTPNDVEYEKAAPDKELCEIIKRLAEDEKNKIVLLSGRDKQTVSKWFEGLNVDLIAEHGVWLKKYGEEWEAIDVLNADWKQEILPTLEHYVNRTPGSFIEEKDFSLVWNYRKVEAGLGELRMREITSHLKYLAAQGRLMAIEGDRVVEIKNMEVNKGKAAMRWVEESDADFILAIGDDSTDEDTFKALPDAVTIRVGSTSSGAKFNLKGYLEVRDFLKKLME